MARPEIQGLKYFPFDTGFFRDKKIRLLRGEQGSDGVEVYQRLLCKCYEENGYYLNWDDSEDYALLADETGHSEEKIRLIVSTCLRRSLFNDTLFEMGNVLTSRSIQRRYFNAIKDTRVKAASQGRHTTIDEDLCLLTKEDFDELNKTGVWLKVTSKNGFSGINDSKSGINSDKSGNNPAKESKEKESKEKESKEKESKEKESKSASDAAPPTPIKRHKYGEYGWVKLTDTEYNRLISEYGENVAIHYITYVDKSAQGTGNKNGWSDWDVTVRRAIEGKWGGGPPKPKYKGKNFDEYD